MPISTLNRSIALLIVGGVAALLLLIHCKTAVVAFAEEIDVGGGGLSTVVFGMGALALSAFLGVLIMGISELTVIFFIQNCARQYEWIHKYIFLTFRNFNELKYWTKYARLGIKKENGEGVEDEIVWQVASGVCLMDSSQAHSEWLSSTYGVYRLSGSFAALSIIETVILLFNPADEYSVILSNGFIFWCVAIAIPYVLARFSINNYLYSYMIVCRFTALQFERNNDQAHIVKAPK